MEKGKLISWNDNKGFGFIKPEVAGSTDVFIHISALKNMARKPIVDDEISYHCEQQADGRFRAIKANIEGVAVVARPPKKPQPVKRDLHMSRPPKSSTKPMMLIFVIVAGIASTAYSQFQKVTSPPLDDNRAQQATDWQAPTQTFRCETGKHHCSQMRSCAEATFYIRNCPDTKMDGDNDGIPCERQLCQ